jgi:hypothetical protein
MRRPIACRIHREAGSRLREEADESEFWLDVAHRKPFGDRTEVKRLHLEARELRAIFGRSLGTARSNAKLLRSVTK